MSHHRFKGFLLTASLLAMLLLATRPTVPPATEQIGYQLLQPQLASAHLRFLASDELEGRETAKRGQKIAARYIASHFERLGLTPLGDSGTFFQRFTVKERRLGQKSQLVVKAGNTVHTYRKLFEDFAFSLRSAHAAELSGTVVFCGYGIRDRKLGYSDYDGVDAKGKMVLLLAGAPRTQAQSAALERWSDAYTKYVAALDAQPAAVCIVVGHSGTPSLAEQFATMKDQLAMSTMSLHQPESEPVSTLSRAERAPLIFISAEVANAILSPRKKTVNELATAFSLSRSASFELKTVRLELTIDVEEDILASENVCAMLEGSDSVMKHEAIVYSAHYDHVGVGISGRVFNGADDDGSGTTAVLMLAEAFAKNGVRPPRSIIFLTVAGEEKGLLGSRFYTEHPKFPLQRTVANLNIDMIGRIDEKYEKLGNPNYVYVIGSDKISKDLDAVLQRQNRATVNLTLDYRYND
ncbi:MAG: M20/M25/M40 family metallo-hydrolase, partial [Chloroherpetonaceae bacterium]|nr:M20/M25/M40 family metallo-hydrolase [Chloroherpetonaceae bacterium]